jgi:hypothetical protein
MVQHLLEAVPQVKRNTLVRRHHQAHPADHLGHFEVRSMASNSNNSPRPVPLTHRFRELAEPENHRVAASLPWSWQSGCQQFGHAVSVVAQNDGTGLTATATMGEKSASS